MKWLLNRLNETSTWEGLTVLLTLVGVSVSPELREAIVAMGGSLYGLIKVIKQEKKD